MHDFRGEEVGRIDDALARQQDFVHYELAFEAQSKMLARDSTGALLMAVMTLEAVHAAFVQWELGSRLPATSDKGLPEKFLKELGIHLCNQITPYLLLKEDERPSEELIKQCKKGIEIRNHIVHAKKTSGSQYRLRTLEYADISDGYSAVLKVYKHYVGALEQRIQSDTSK